MVLQIFIPRRYSVTAGESPLGHVLAISAGFALLVIATLLIASLVWIPAGIVFGIAGLLTVTGGIWGHTTRPLNLEDLADSMVKVTGAAIAMAVAGIIMGFALTIVVSLFRWLVS